MKKLVLLSMVCTALASGVMAQYEDEGKGFKKENLFTGGSVTVSFFNKQTILGANPMFGYKLANWIDAGLVFNFVYSGARDYLEFDDKVRQTVYGPGVFTRIYPINFLFFQGQLEHNFSKLKYTPGPAMLYAPYKRTTGANSLLVGGGIAQGREGGSTTFYYISLLFDVLKNKDSPYVNVSYNPNNPSQQRVDIVPIIRAGLNIGLFQKRFERE